MMLKATLYIFMLLFLVYNFLSCDQEIQKDKSQVTDYSMYFITIAKLSVNELYDTEIGGGSFKDNTEFRQAEDEISKGIIPRRISSNITLPADATISGGSPFSMINSLQKRYLIVLRSDLNGFKIYGAGHLGFAFDLIIGNQSSTELLLSGDNFWMEDRDVNAVYRKYMLEKSKAAALPVKILPHGTANAEIGFVVNLKPTGIYKLIANLNGVQILVDLPKYELNKEGEFSSS